MKSYIKEEIIDKLSKDNIDLKEVNINDVDNIDDVVIDDNKNNDDRIMDFLSKVRNPYFFNIDGFIVKFSYNDNGINAEECIENVMKHII